MSRRAIGLYLAIFCAACGNKAGDVKAAQDDIRQLIAKSAAAVDAADLDLASQVWRTSPEISFIHPGGYAHGWEEVKGFYKFFSSAFSERKLTVRDVSVHANGTTAWAEYVWHFVAKQGKDGPTFQTDGRETDLFEKTGDRWQMVHAHYSSPMMPQ